MDIIMKSSKYRVVNILKKSSAKMFEDIEAGDIIQFSVPIKSSYSRATIKVENLSKPNNVAYKTFNQLPSILRSFKLDELYE